MPLTYPLLMTYRLQGDIRDMPGATWRDIIADAMESFHTPVALEQIYEAVGSYKRAQQQQHWKDKVRQTLQHHPNTFYSTGRGVWGLKQCAALC